MAIAANVSHDGASLASGGSTSLVLNKPSGTVQGDLMTVEIVLSANVAITPPAGWTTSVNAAGAKAYWKVAGSSEPASYTFTRAANTNTIVGHIARHTGTHLVSPVDTASAVSGSGASVVIPTLTVGATATMLVMMCAVLSNSTWTPPGTATEDYDYQPATQTFGVSGAHEAATAGATGTRTFTPSTTGPYMGVMWSLIPASAYDLAVIADAPSWYGLTNEASGLLLDASGNARVSTLPGGSPTYQQAGPSGASDAQAWPDSAGGTEFYAQVASVVGSSGVRTLECWFKVSGTPTNPTPLVGAAFGYGNNSRRPTEMYLDTDLKVKVLSSTSGTANPSILATSSAVSTGQWYHAVGVFNSGVLRKIRLNKVDSPTDAPVVSFTSAGIIYVHGGGTDIGGIVDLTNGSAVSISKPAVYDGVALSDARIDAHYDAMITGSSLTQSASDSLTLSDSRVATPGLSESDSVTLSDARTASVGAAKADAVTLTDATAKSSGKPAADSVVFTDALTRTPKPARADVVGLTDAVSLHMGKALADNVALADDTAHSPGVKLADGLTIADSLTKATGVTEGDGTTLTDSIALHLVHVIADTVTLSEDISNADTVGLEVSDSIAFTDARTATIRLSLADAVTLADTAARHHLDVIADSLPLSETLALILRRRTADSLPLSEALALTLRKRIADTITFTTSPVFTWGHLVDLSDELTLDDQLHHGAPRDITATATLAPPTWTAVLAALSWVANLDSPSWTATLEDT